MKQLYLPLHGGASYGYQQQSFQRLDVCLAEGKRICLRSEMGALHFLPPQKLASSHLG